MNIKRLPSLIMGAVIAFNMFTIVLASPLAAPVLTAPSATLIDAKTGIVIVDKDMNSKQYPASITKIMTTLIALEHCSSDLEQRVLFSRLAVYSIPRNSSHIAMDEGETLSMDQALFAIMLESANEVANAVSEHIGGTTEKFALMMTKRAKELGANNTNFSNPHGLHDENHYTTAYDMALIMKEAVKHPEFTNLITTTHLQLPPTEKQEDERPLNNSHKMIQAGHAYYNENVVGGKTGFTNEAGNTLVTYAKKGDMELIAVIMHDASAAKAYEDTNILLEYGFSTFTDIKVFDSATFKQKLSIIEEREGGTQDNGLIDVYANEDVTLNIPSTVNLSEIKQELDMPFEMKPPVLKDQQVGTLKLTLNNQELASVKLYAASEALAPVEDTSTENDESFLSRNHILKIVLFVFGILIVVLAFIAIFSRVQRKKRKKLRTARRKGSAASSNGMPRGTRNRPQQGNYSYRGTPHNR